LGRTDYWYILKAVKRERERERERERDYWYSIFLFALGAAKKNLPAYIKRYNAIFYATVYLL
jgi:hypothetical protein